MSNLTISVFGNKIFLEIINEIKLFSKFKIKYYEDLNACIRDAEKESFLVIFFVNKENKNFFNNNKTYNFPSILIFDSSSSLSKQINGLKEQLIFMEKNFQANLTCLQFLKKKLLVSKFFHRNYQIIRFKILRSNKL